MSQKSFDPELIDLEDLRSERSFDPEFAEAMANMSMNSQTSCIYLLYVFMYVCVCVCVCVCLYVCMYACMYVCNTYVCVVCV